MAGTGKGATPRQQELGRRVRERRGELGLSQEALALAADIHRTYVATVEVGERNPSIETLCKLAVGLRCDVAELVAGLQAVD